jgi:hypothetical protein
MKCVENKSEERTVQPGLLALSCPTLVRGTPRKTSMPFLAKLPMRLFVVLNQPLAKSVAHQVSHSVHS